MQHLDTADAPHVEHDPFKLERVEARIQAIATIETELLVVRRQIVEGETLDGVHPDLPLTERALEGRLRAVRLACPLTTDLY